MNAIWKVVDQMCDVIHPINEPNTEGEEDEVFKISYSGVMNT